MALINNNENNYTANAELNIMAQEVVSELMKEAKERENSNSNQIDEIIEEEWEERELEKLPKIKPNEPCICNSGKKFKKCCKNNIVDKRKEIQFELQNISKNTVKFYNNTVRDGLKLVSPEEYLERQDINRTFWEKLKFRCEQSNNFTELQNSSMYIYLNHMYDNYPAGMGNRIQLLKSENKKIDLPHIYYNMKLFNESK